MTSNNVIGKIEVSASGMEFVRPLGHQAAKAVPNHIDRWRRENPNHVVRQEVKSTGGAWVQFWGFRVYYGPCGDCRGLVTTRRKIAHKKDGATNTARWPKYCAECRRKRAEAHDAGAAERMRRVRNSYGESPRGGQGPKKGVDPTALGVNYLRDERSSSEIVRKPQPLVCARCLLPTTIVATRRKVDAGPSDGHHCNL